MTYSINWPITVHSTVPEIISSQRWWRWWWQLDYRFVVLQSNHNHQQTSNFLQAGCSSCRPTSSIKALKRKISHSMDCLPHAHLGVFQLCLWPLIAPGYLSKAKQSKAKMCNGRRHVPLCPASANEKYIVQKCNYNTILSSVFTILLFPTPVNSTL